MTTFDYKIFVYVILNQRVPVVPTLTLTLTLTLTTKLSVVEQDVNRAKSLGYNVLGRDVLGQDVGHPRNCPDKS